MSFEKWEDCPQCNCSDTRWLYELQVCEKCGWPMKDKYGFTMQYYATHPMRLVKEFHEKFNHPIADMPENIHNVLDDDLQRLIGLRMDLIREEYEELQTAFSDSNEIEICDALCDLVYVIYGFALSMGWDINAMFAEVHRSNMSKLGEDGNPVVRKDGKILKGENYSPPNLAQFFARK